jgi:hypothetical protein
MIARLQLVVFAGALGCGNASPTPPPASSASPGDSKMTTPVMPAPVGLGSGAVDQGAAEDELSTQPMELLRFRFTSGIDSREPRDDLREARPGQRVYAFLAIRNRTGNKRGITLAWSVGGEPRTTLELDVDESWQYRTWGYNTVGPADRGTLRLEVTDDAGNSLVERELPIRP